MRNIYFYFIITFHILEFFWDQFLSHLDRTRMTPVMPEQLEGIYDIEAYAKQQAYQRENSRFDTFSDWVLFVPVTVILWCGGVGWLDDLLRRYIDNAVLLSIAFFWSVSVCARIIDIPFDWYDTFVIEQKFGFNRTTRRTFVTDWIKGIIITLVLEALMIAILITAYEYIQDYSWLWAWGAVSAVSLTVSFFYSEWIVPLFNKQTPLEEGELRSAIEVFAQNASFPIHNIYVIDGSKRSTKSNAYFTGFGRKKRIVLYDTLINDLTAEEIVAVLAHEIGHYKKKHVLYTIAGSLSFMGILLWGLTLFLKTPEVSYALGGITPSFHLGLAGFSLLYSPLSEVFDFLTSYVSRKHEYAADNFVVKYGMGEALISALKKISSKSLSNLTPHPFVVFWSYSHPTLLQRIANIRKI